MSRLRIGGRAIPVSFAPVEVRLLGVDKGLDGYFKEVVLVGSGAFATGVNRVLERYRQGPAPQYQGRGSVLLTHWSGTFIGEKVGRRRRCRTCSRSSKRCTTCCRRSSQQVRDHGLRGPAFSAQGHLARHATRECNQGLVASWRRTGTPEPHCASTWWVESGSHKDVERALETLQQMRSSAQVQVRWLCHCGFVTLAL